MKIFNLNADDWDRTEEREGWRFKDAWVGAHTDAELIGASMYEVEPGNKQGPFHTHHANEEWAIVLRGEPTLRTHEGEQQLRQGDVVAFPRGKEGAHQIRNDTDAPVRVLMLSTLIAPDIVEYLDTGKISARSVAGERIIFARPGPELAAAEGRRLRGPRRQHLADLPGRRARDPDRRPARAGYVGRGAVARGPRGPARASSGGQRPPPGAGGARAVVAPQPAGRADHAE